MDEIKNREIILPELQTFMINVGLRDYPKGLRVRTFNRLFCERYSKNVWFYNGKLYGVRMDNENLAVFELNTENIGVLRFGNPPTHYAYRALFWLSIILFAVLTTNSWYFFIVIGLVIVALFYDKIVDFINKIRLIGLK